MVDFFKKLKDEDFYSDKLTHLYLEGSINLEIVNKLITEIKNANKIENSKPILIHINSEGGSIQDSIRLMSIYKISKVPIATIIDNYSFSAATFLSINSNYRLITKNGFCLLHEYSFSTFINYKRHDLLNVLTIMENYYKNIKDMYLKKTLITNNDLLELMEHNIFLDSKYCLNKKIVDRIINFEYKNKTKNKIDINTLLNNNNVNNIYLDCNMSNKDFEVILNTNINNPYNIYISKTNCEIKTMFIYETYFKSFYFIDKIKSIKSQKIGIIDIPISLELLLPLLYTDKIYMYSNTYIILNIENNNIQGILLNDIINNNKKIFNIIKKILKEKTKLKSKDINNINKKYLILNPHQAKEFGICHEIINI